MSMRMKTTILLVSLFVFLVILVCLYLFEFSPEPEYQNEIEENILNILSDNFLDTDEMTLKSKGKYVTYQCHTLRYRSVTFDRTTGQFSWDMRSDINVFRISVLYSLFLSVTVAGLIVALITMKKLLKQINPNKPVDV